MPDPTSTSTQTLEDFLRVARSSGLVDAGKLDEAVAPWKDMTGPVPEDCIQTLIDRGLLTAWQLEQLRKGRHKGFVLGKYKLLRLLGAGGMSSVYLAEHTTLHNKVAIKVLPVKRVEQTSYLARFEREAQASARLSHPHIARAYDLDTSGTIHFIVMEYIDGIDLHARVKQDGPLSVRDAADCLRQAALGLQHAHDEGLVHRDIKPANLMIDKRGHVRILDLGLALASDDQDASLTKAHDEKVLGTADYLAPEQARDSHKADGRSDIYSLGCTLYYLLVGKAPFAKGSLGERIRGHMTEPPPNLLDARPDVPAAIAEIYFRMMEKHPDARQQSAQEIADSLTAWLATTAGTTGRQRAEPPRRPSLRRTAKGTTGGETGRLSGDTGSGTSNTGSGSGRSASGSGTHAIGSGTSGVGSSASGVGTSAIGGFGSGAAVPAPGSRSGAHARPQPQAEVDLQSLSFTPPSSSGSGSTGRLPNVPSKPAAPAMPPGGVFINTNTASAAGKRGGAESLRPPAPTTARVAAVPARSAIPGWLSRRYGGLPLAVWLAAALLLTCILVVAGWLLLGGSADTTQGDDASEAVEAVDDNAAFPIERPPLGKKNRLIKPKTGSPKTSSTKPQPGASAKPRKPSPDQEPAGPSLLDGLGAIQPDKPPVQPDKPPVQPDKPPVQPDKPPAGNE
jgi:serine/threonine-protein kinase